MTPDFESITNKVCQGIGANATCGQKATVRLSAHRWDMNTEEMREISIFVCSEHATELRSAMSAKRLITPEHG